MIDPNREPSSPDLGKTAAEPEALEISLVDLLLILVRHRRPLMLTAAICAILGLLSAFLLPVRFSATTTILPPQQSSSFSSSVLSQLGGLGAMAGVSGLPGLKSPTDLYVGLLKSATVENGMVKRFNLLQEYKVKRPSDARKALEKHITIDGSGKDGLIRVTVESYSPDRAAELANGYISQYRQLSASLAIGEASQRRLFLEQQLQQSKNNLSDSEEQLKQTEQTTGMIQLDSQARALIESAAALRAQVAAKEVQVQSMRTYAGAGNVDLLQAEQELSSLRAELAKLGGGQGSNQELIMPKGRLPQAGLEYARKLRDVKYNETIFGILARQYEAARLDEAREGSIIQVVDTATPPDRKSWPPRLLFGLGGLVLGLLAGSTRIIWKELSQRLAGLTLTREATGAVRARQPTPHEVSA